MVTYAQFVSALSGFDLTSIDGAVNAVVAFRAEATRTGVSITLVYRTTIIVVAYRREITSNARNADVVIRAEVIVPTDQRGSLATDAGARLTGLLSVAGIMVIAICVHVTTTRRIAWRGNAARCGTCIDRTGVVVIAL
jgi:hypothetical protein